jgi:protein-L-isoaspartate O-methyltransferase
MAWTSIATSNDDLVDKLVSLKIIENSSIEKAFRATDRGIFAGLDYANADEAIHVYSDRPFKNHLIHLSAPHIYATILNALSLKEGHAFLNIGSGTGYLSSLVLCLLGDGGLSHGIDVNQQLVNHSQESCKRWLSDIIQSRRNDKQVPAVSPEGVTFVFGNCFDIDMSASNTCKYDRIYIGAGCPQRYLKFFLGLLSEDGILVAPIIERAELVKIQKVVGSVYTVDTISAAFYAPLLRIPLGRSFGSDLLVYDSDVNHINHGGAEVESEDEQMINDDEIPDGAVTDHANNILSGSATENLTGQSGLVKLPSIIWWPRASRHRQYPPEFKDSIFQLFLAVRFSNKNVSMFCRLDYYLLVSIVRFMTRDWFTLLRPPVELLREEVREERKMRLNAERSLLLLQQTHSRILRERNALRNLVLRLQTATISLEHEHFHTVSGEVESDGLEIDTDDEEGSGSQSNASLPLPDIEGQDGMQELTISLESAANASSANSLEVGTLEVRSRSSSDPSASSSEAIA